MLNNDHMAAIVFSVTTAVISALNAAYSPADTAKAHRVAATRFGHSLHRLEDMGYVLDAGGEDTIFITKTEYTPDGRPYDAGHYAAATQLTPAELSQLAGSLANITVEIETTEEAAPTINRLRKARGSTIWDGVPETFWGVRRYKRKLRYAAEARKCYEQATRERMAWFSSAQHPRSTPSSGNGRN